MSEAAQAQVNPDKLNAFMGRMLGDLGALTNAVLVHLGDQLGLYKVLVRIGPATSAKLAAETGTAERLVREWLSAQAAQGYVSYDKATGEFSLSPEQAMVFAHDDSPVFMAGFFDVARGVFDDTPKIVKAFKTVNHAAKHMWCILNGRILYIDGQRSFFSWGPKADPPESFQPLNDWMGRDIEKMARNNRYLDAQSVHELRDVMASSTALDAAAQESPQATAMTAVRAIEHVNTWTTGGVKNWVDFASAFLKKGSGPRPRGRVHQLLHAERHRALARQATRRTSRTSTGARRNPFETQ